MEELQFKQAHSKKDLIEIEALGKEIWNEHFIKIISQEQIDYMLDKFQSISALKEQIKDAYEYYLINLGSVSIGYMGIQKRHDCLFLSKIYIKKDYRGKGFGRKSIDFAKIKAKDFQLEKIILTVNKQNTSSIKAYESNGFITLEEAQTAIGKGFIMDDYVMCLYL